MYNPSFKMHIARGDCDLNEELLEGIKRDTITNLPYVDDFCGVSEKILEQKTTKQYHLIAFDIANFKLVNNNYGFQSGDRLLNKAINQFCIENKACQIATRIYSDHIVALYETDESKELVVEKVTRFNNDFISAVQKEYPIVPIHIHSGIYKITDRSEHITKIIDKANMARKAAKGHYKIDCVLYDESLLHAQERVAEIITALEEGIKNNNILVLLQPKVNVKTHKVVGAEALSRLVDKDGNIIRPDEFIPILEKTGKIVDLDKYVLDYVVKLLEKWYGQGFKDYKISVNMSRVHFYFDDLAEQIIKKFETFNIPPKLLEFEVTESVFLSDTDMIIEKIAKLRDYGFKISIDDFGSGYSSLNLISILPVDIVKLDKGFINTSLNTKRGKEIMRGLIKMLSEIELDIICEGIETAEEEEVVYEFGCNEVQGFLYDKPIKVEEFTKKYLINQ